MKSLVSVIVPVYNESENLYELHRRLTEVMSETGHDYEIVAVDDGSTDDTGEILRELSKKDPRVRAVILSRNFGKEVAMTAGLDHSHGEMVIPIDADLQDPPELIPAMIARADEGFDVVYAKRKQRKGEGVLKLATASLFYRFINMISSVNIPENTGDFRLMRRTVVNAVGMLRERKRFMKGLFAWVGYRQTEISYDREARFAGTTKWNFWKLWNFAIEGITSFSSLPLRVWSYLGAGIAVLAFVYAIIAIIRVLRYGIDVPGYASLLVVTLFLGGLQLITLGIIGEYIGRMFEEIKARPLYLVREVYGRGEELAAGPGARQTKRINPGRKKISGRKSGR
ncbi:MAG: glycosyltransferase family 2 protein [Spirochaetia bacterium]|nr:glycosyltransferase family 2 protein [Spirochaetia bacterium]